MASQQEVAKVEWQFAKKEKLLDEIDAKDLLVEEEPEYVTLEDLEDEDFYGADPIEHADEDPNEVCWEEEHLSKDELADLLQYNLEVMQAIARDEAAKPKQSYKGIKGVKKPLGEVSRQTLCEINKMLASGESTRGVKLSPEKIADLKKRKAFAEVGLMPVFFSDCFRIACV